MQVTRVLDLYALLYKVTTARLYIPTAQLGGNTRG